MYIVGAWLGAVKSRLANMNYRKVALYMRWLSGLLFLLYHT